MARATIATVSTTTAVLVSNCDDPPRIPVDSRSGPVSAAEVFVERSGESFYVASVEFRQPLHHCSE